MEPAIFLRTTAFASLKIYITSVKQEIIRQVFEKFLLLNVETCLLFFDDVESHHLPVFQSRYESRLYVRDIEKRDIEIKEGIRLTQSRLPHPFIERMAALLGDDFHRFLATYDEPRVSGLRANRNKISPEALRDRLQFLSESVPWTTDGFYFDEAFRPAKHPYYYAGLYYIQEPSAMLPAELLAARPGDRVLDLCAAPGGKSVQLAAQLGREGLLIVNDIHPARAKVLLKNIER
jgi:16S rRNA C967 or C1407 C5-methylase (RsmB/RsmF family)